MTHFKILAQLPSPQVPWQFRLRSRNSAAITPRAAPQFPARERARLPVRPLAPSGRRPPPPRHWRLPRLPQTRKHRR
jgi:hypothetical protein